MCNATRALLVVAITLLVPMSALSQQYPSRPVRIVTGASGIFHDIVTREVGKRLSERWGQPVVVENQPAAALTIGTGIVARATPDGHTLLMSDRSALAVAPHLYKSLPYDVTRDFAPIILAALAPSMLLAHPSLPAANLPEFLAYAKQQSKGMQLATAGPGTNSHVAMELFKVATGLKIDPVHYKGGGASTLAILSGEVKAGFALVPAVLPHVRSGKMKAYIVTGRQRFAGVPDLPTAAESGLPGFEIEFWLGMLAPARTPASLVARLNREVSEILRAPDVRKALLLQGAEPAPGSSEAFAAYIKDESSKMKRLVEATAMSIE